MLLLAVGVVGAIVWALRAREEAHAAAQEAANERQHAREAEEYANEAQTQLQAVCQQAAKERNDLLAEMHSATRKAEVTRAVVLFLQDKLLSAARAPGGIENHWTEGKGKDVMLRQALDAAAHVVAKACADRPLVEAGVREVLGAAYLDLGAAELAVTQYEKALALREAVLGCDHPDTVACRNQLARAYRLAGRAVEAAALYDPSRGTSCHAAALALQGTMLLSQKNNSQAERKLRESLAIFQKLRPNDWMTFDVQSQLGEALLRQQKCPEAKPLLLAGYRGLRKCQANIPPQDSTCVTSALRRIVQLYGTWGKEDQAAQWRKELEALK